MLGDDPSRPEVRLRQGEADIMRGLMLAIDQLIEHIHPSLVVHSGDLFESPRPSPHILNFAMTQLRRLSDAGIQVVIVEGDHSWPRDSTHGHVLRLMAHLPNVSIACDDAVRIDIVGIALHLLPHRALALGRAPERATISRDIARVLVTHGVADGLHFFRTGRAASDLAVRECASWYDYVALGHCHRFSQVPGTDRAFYAGSTAMVTFGDFRPGHHFGFNVVQLGEIPPKVDRVVLPTRPMQAYGLDNATGLSAAEVLTYLSRQIAALPPEGAICAVAVNELDPLTRRELATRDVTTLFEQAAIVLISLRTREQRWDAVHADLIAGGDPLSRFTQLVAQTDGDEAFRSDVHELGTRLLGRAAAQITAEETGEGSV